MSFEALHRELRHWRGEAVCQALAEYLVVTILELYGQEEGHNTIDFFLHLQFLTSLAVTCRCNSSIKDKKVPSEKLLPSRFRVLPSLSAILSERLRLFCFRLFLHYRPHSLSFLAPFPLRLKLHRAQMAAVVCLLPVL